MKKHKFIDIEICPLTSENKDVYCLLVPFNKHFKKFESWVNKHDRIYEFVYPHTMFVTTFNINMYTVLAYAE